MLLSHYLSSRSLYTPARLVWQSPDAPRPAVEAGDTEGERQRDAREAAGNPKNSDALAASRTRTNERLATIAQGNTVAASPSPRPISSADVLAARPSTTDRSRDISVTSSSVDTRLEQGCLTRIAERSDLRNARDFSPDVYGRITFTAEGKDGTPSRYIATTTEVLRVLPNTYDKTALRQELSDLKQQFETALARDTAVSPVLKNKISQFITKRGFADLPLFDYSEDGALSKDNPGKMPAAYANLLAHARSVGKDIALADATILADDKQPTQRIIEQVAYGRLTRTHEVGGVRSCEVIYGAHGKAHETTYDSYGGLKDTTMFDETGAARVRSVKQPDGSMRTLMVDDTGQTFGLLREGKAGEKPPTDAEKEAYLAMLAQKLNTPQKLALYLEAYMEYTEDDGHLAKKPDSKVNADEYWQTPQQTLDEVVKGKMLGDCDDYATFAKEILRRQGKEVSSVAIPNHAICAWVEKRPDGTYDGYSICTYGLDKNGQRYGKAKNTAAQDGYPTAQDALNAIMTKYDKEGLGVKSAKPYRVDTYIYLNYIPKEGEQLIIAAPVEALLDPAVRVEAERADQAVKSNDYATARGIYERWAQAKGTNVDLANTLGSLAEKQGDINASATWYARALQQDPTNKLALSNLSLAASNAQNAGDKQTAASAARAVLWVDPDNKLSQMVLADAQRALAATPTSLPPTAPVGDAQPTLTSRFNASLSATTARVKGLFS